PFHDSADRLGRESGGLRHPARQIHKEIRSCLFPTCGAACLGRPFAAECVSQPSLWASCSSGEQLPRRNSPSCPWAIRSLGALRILAARVLAAIAPAFTLTCIMQVTSLLSSELRSRTLHRC